MITDRNAPFVDAVALIRASERHDGEAVRRVLNTCDTEVVAQVLAQMVGTAIRTQGMSFDGFLEMQVDKSLENSAEEDFE